MIFLLYMLLDLVTALVLVLAQFDLSNKLIMFYHATYLVVKGVWYWTAWPSWLDVFIGIWIFLMIFGLKSWLSYVFAAYFLLKFVTFLATRT